MSLITELSTWWAWRLTLVRLTKSIKCNRTALAWLLLQWYTVRAQQQDRHCASHVPNSIHKFGLFSVNKCKRLALKGQGGSFDAPKMKFRLLALVEKDSLPYFFFKFRIIYIPMFFIQLYFILFFLLLLQVLLLFSLHKLEKNSWNTKFERKS